MLQTDLEIPELERDDMPRPKAPEPKPESRQKIVLVYKADERVVDDFKAWLEDLAKEVKAPISVLLDMALNEYAKKRKFRPMPDRLLK